MAAMVGSLYSAQLPKENSENASLMVFKVQSAGRYFKVPAGTLMCRPVLQNVLEVPAGTSNPNQSAKYKLEVPAGTSNPNQSAGRLINNLLQGPTPKFGRNVDLHMRQGSNRFCTDVPSGTCDDRVNALLSVLKGFGYPKEFADNWQGNDPCDNWKGIVCLSGSKVSVVNFRSMGLSGTISPNFSLLPSITKLILSDNFISSTIPTELTKLPNLVELDVSNNRLFGNVPSFRNGMKVSIDGNPDIGKDKSSAPSPSPPGSPTVPGGGGGDSPASGEKKSKTGIIVGAVIGVVGGLLLVGAAVLSKRLFIGYAWVEPHLSLASHPGPQLLRLTETRVKLDFKLSPASHLGPQHLARAWHAWTRARRMGARGDNCRRLIGAWRRVKCLMRPILAADDRSASYESDRGAGCANRGTEARVLDLSRFGVALDIIQGAGGTTSTEEVINILVKSYKSSGTFQEVQQLVSKICQQAVAGFGLLSILHCVYVSGLSSMTLASPLALSSLMMIVASIVPDFLMGIITGAGIQGVMMFNGGFFRLPDDLPKPFWKYPMYYTAFHKYTNQGFYKNEFEGLTFPNNQVSGPPTITGEEILRNIWQVEMGYSKWIDLAILFGMVVLYRLMFLGIVKTVEKVKSRC
uniref:Leucine-rich repeat-containing N-terminal plant-type domain-containing protein n=1 Tax=Fagus sylvatica TaxID=28930 RepID=A0A2N9J3R8_FAGSY